MSTADSELFSARFIKISTWCGKLRLCFKFREPKSNLCRQFFSTIWRSEHSKIDVVNDIFKWNLRQASWFVTETCHKLCWHNGWRQTIQFRSVSRKILTCRDRLQFWCPTFRAGLQRGRRNDVIDLWNDVTLKFSLQLLKFYCYHVKSALVVSWLWVRIHSEKGKLIS